MDTHALMGWLFRRTTYLLKYEIVMNSVQKRVIDNTKIAIILLVYTHNDLVVMGACTD